MMILFDSADVKPAAIARPFAAGLVPPPVAGRRMPYTAADVAWARAFDLSLDAGHRLPPPSGMTEPAEVAAWEAGAAAAQEALDARLAELELEAAWQDHCELAEARMATPGEWRD